MSNLKDFLGGLDPSVWTDAKAGYLDAAITSRAAAATALSTATWTGTRAGYLDNLDATVSSRAPSSTALSSNVWTTAYRDRIDANISSRLSSCSVQRLSTRTSVNSDNDYDTWSISSVNTSKTFLTCSAGGISHGAWGSNAGDAHIYAGITARFIDSTDVRYVMGSVETGYSIYIYYFSSWRAPGLMNNNQFYNEITTVQIS
tara:strand:+ start:16281 stop:16886 length:606 start_codon:yes stop_codon:yes gene_type:complete